MAFAKGKVESGIGHTQKTPLKGMRFESLEEAQLYLDRWEQRWADTRIRATTKRQAAAMFVDYILAGIVVVGLLGYLLFALLHPEKL